MAGGVLGAYANLYKENHPIVTIMEPTNAACMFKSASINDGSPHKVDGSLHSIMAGLACGEPIPMGWEIIRDFANCYCTCPDYVTARGMRILASPIGEDEKNCFRRIRSCWYRFIIYYYAKKICSPYKENSLN